MTLRKKDIAIQIQEDMDLLQCQSKMITEALIEIIKTTLESGEDVLISGFGKFCVQDKQSRKGRNPATGETMLLAPRKIVTFRSSGKLRQMLNEN